MVVRQVWVRLRSSEPGDEVRVDVQSTGLVDDLLRVSLSALEFPRRDVRANSLRAVDESGRRLPNRTPLATLQPDAVILLDLQEPAADTPPQPTNSTVPFGLPDHSAPQTASRQGVDVAHTARGGGGRAERASTVKESFTRTTALRRLMRELKLAQTDPSWGVSAAPVEDFFTWHCNVAGHPKHSDTPIVLHLELTFPDDYPTRPPRVEVLGSTVRHPNVFATFICLDMLEAGEWAADEEKRRPYCGWSSAYSILAVLRQLQTFFFEGDGTQWWDCTRCTLRNPISRKRCDACDHPRGSVREVSIDVTHKHAFQCRCGHTHSGPAFPPFPDPVNCDDAPTAQHQLEEFDDACVICLGGLDPGPRAGPLRGAPLPRPLAHLASAGGGAVCPHRFHKSCAECLVGRQCPLCRSPFEHVVESKPTPGKPQKGPPACEALCDVARDRMARLADWPSLITVRLMSCLRRPERSTLARAVPAWRDAVQAPIFWEVQELQCFHEKIGPSEDVIGFGVHTEGRGRLAKLTAHFDAVSLTAWRGGLRRTAWKEPMTHWLPLYVDRTHAQRARELCEESLGFLAECVSAGADSHLPPLVFPSLAQAQAPEAAKCALQVLPELMHQLLKQVLDGDRHASAKVLKGYFVLHRLLLYCCDLWPAIRQAADAAVLAFASSPEQRTKAATPWIAYILQLLTISNVRWQDVRWAFLEEVLARQVQFIRASFPNYVPHDPDAQDPKDTTAAQEDPWSEWQLSEVEHGSERHPGDATAKAEGGGRWCGRPRGWAWLHGAERPERGRHAFSVRVLELPHDGVIRIGWCESTAQDCDPFTGCFFYSDGGCFGRGSWKSSSRGAMVMYGRPVEEGDVLTACIDHGTVSFNLNGQDLGAAFTNPSKMVFRPVVALRRAARIELLEANTAANVNVFASPEQLRSMAWEARLNRRGNQLVLFQVFFLSLVRPGGEGAPNWEDLKQEYDKRMGFPSPELSAALMEHFGEVNRITSLKGSKGWSRFFQLLGFGEVSNLDLDRMLFAAYQRASTLNYKMGGRNDHA